MTEKARTFSRLLNVHDKLYDAISTLEDTKITQNGLADRLSKVLEDLEVAEKQLNQVVELTWWKKDE